MKRCANCGQETDATASSCAGCGGSEFSETEALFKSPSTGRPWVGVLFSLLIPGFGIARGDRLGQALGWFLGLELGFVLVVLCFALERIPFSLALVAGASFLAAELAMLYQSYRPGRMTVKHWAAFAGLLVLTLIAPSPSQFVARPFKMPTGSMRPTLQGASGQGDHILVDRLTYRLSSPRRGDLLAFLTEGIPSLPQDQVYVKRIVGMPGERIEIRDGSVFANGARLTERDGIPPIRFVTRAAVEQSDGASTASYEVDKEGYFVVGDNSSNSLDSRFFGCVPRQNVYGKVTAIYYPFSRAGRPRYAKSPRGK
jgi:signal peptidase I